MQQIIYFMEAHTHFSVILRAFKRITMEGPVNQMLLLMTLSRRVTPKQVGVQASATTRGS